MTRFGTHHATEGAFRYLFIRLDLSAFERALTRWITARIDVDPDQLRPTPLAGKTLRGSDDHLRGAVHLPALLNGPTGGVLKQTAVDGKTNEHKATFELLRGLVGLARSRHHRRCDVLSPRPGGTSSGTISSRSKTTRRP